MNSLSVTQFLPGYRRAIRLLLSNADTRTNMSNDSRKTVEELLGPMLKKRLFVAISRAATSASAIKPFVAEHLAYMNALEEEWAPLGVRAVHRGGRPRRRRSDDPVDEHNRRGAAGHGRGAAHQARAAHLRAQKMGAARGPDRYLPVRLGQPVFA